MSVVGLVVHEGRDAAVAAARDLEAALAATDVASVDLTKGAPVVDLAVSVGGDGTFLRAAHLAAQARVPVLGVKVGRLGFLTEVEPPEAAALIADALAGSARIEERLAVVAEPADGGAFPPEWALNEIMVEKRARHRLIRLRVEVDGDYVTTFSADGVIVATPTGSTAYSFSARGPIVTPDVPCLVLTPIAAHMVFDRSFVLAADQSVVLTVVGDEPGLVSADGRETHEIAVGTSVRIRASGRPARLVRRPTGAGFLARVREKFDLPGGSAPGDVGGGG
ncbi:MAG TPA: NAD(+)/NADH kinase [Actinomycetota bacterium]|nr:NAD(+)/NADH kinase [Actinomycetota bacterium]